MGDQLVDIYDYTNPWAPRRVAKDWVEDVDRIDRLDLDVPEYLRGPERALCAGTGDRMFDDLDGRHDRLRHSVRARINLCQACPLKRPCLAFALDHNEQYGIWGGYTPTQRRTMRRIWTTQVEVVSDD